MTQISKNLFTPIPQATVSPNLLASIQTPPATSENLVEVLQTPTISPSANSQQEGGL